MLFLVLKPFNISTKSYKKWNLPFSSCKQVQRDFLVIFTCFGLCKLTSFSHNVSNQKIKAFICIFLSILSYISVPPPHPPMTGLHNSLLDTQTDLTIWHGKTRKEMEIFPASSSWRSGWSVALNTVSSALTVSIFLKFIFPL